ncbi:TauD/TfdA family dioxygenase [Streptomyces capparidis]
MTDATAAALAGFCSAWQAAELGNARTQREILGLARERIPEFGRLLDGAVAAVRRELAVVVGNVPLDDTALVVVAAALGAVDPSHNGPEPDTVVHDVVDSAARPYRDPDPLHTDSPLLPRPHAHLGLLCVRPSPTGDGQTVLARAADVAAALAGTGHLRALQDPRYPFAVPGAAGKDGPAVVTHPILTVSGGDTAVRYCPVRVADGVRLAGPALDAEHVAAFHAFRRALDAPHLGSVFLLGAGDLLLLDNRRLLHGRTDVSPNGATRHLKRVKVLAAGE